MYRIRRYVCSVRKAGMKQSEKELMLQKVEWFRSRQRAVGVDDVVYINAWHQSATRSRTLKRILT